MNRSSRGILFARHGFTLFELLVTLILFTAFALVASQVFRMTIRTLEDVPAKQDRVRALDGVIEVLRRDVWAAAKIERVDDSMLQLNSGSATGRVRWRIQTDGIERTADARPTSGGELPERKWAIVDRISFVDSRGASVVVGVGEERIELPSQMVLLKADGGKQ